MGFVISLGSFKLGYMKLILRYIQIFALLIMIGGAGAATGCKAAPKIGSDSSGSGFFKGRLYTQPDIPHAQLGDNVTPISYALDLTIDPREDHMFGLVTINVDIAQPTKAIWIHAKNIEVSECYIVQNDQLIKLDFTPIDSALAPSGIAQLTSEQTLTAGAGQITFIYSTPYNLALNSAYKVSRDGDDYILTQFEALGAREAFPSFDEPRFKVPFDVTITAPSEYTVFANMPPLAVSDKGAAWSQHVFARTPALPTYLLAFGVGPWDVARHEPIAPNDIRARPIELRGVAAKGEAKNMQYALERTAGLLAEFERYFESEYPYEKLDLIAAPDFAYAAMENPGAIVYREYLMLLNEESAQTQKDSYMRVHAHELAHQWFGNLVTPIWWEDIWLNEAFATWLGNKMAARFEPNRVHERVTLNSSLSAMELDSLPSTRAVQEPLLRSENVIDQFDAITYRKGGGVLSMIESYLGEQAFQKGVHLYMQRHAGGIASSDDFFDALAEGAGDAQIVPALKSFVDQPGLPLISISVDETSSDKDVAIRMTQSRYAALGAKIEGANIDQEQSWIIPLCLRIGYEGQKAGANEDKKECLLLTDKTQNLVLDKSEDAKPLWIMPNVDGAGYYRFALSPQLWRSLLLRLDHLSEREMSVVLDSLIASFKMGDIEPAIFLEGITRFAGLADHETAQSAGDVLDWMSQIITPEARPDLARFTRALYGEKYLQLIGGKKASIDAHAPIMAQRLILFGEDEALERSFAKQGALYLGLDGADNKTAIEPSFLKLALISVMRQRGQEALEPLLQLAQFGSAYEKNQAVAALGYVNDEPLAARLLDIIGPEQSVLTGRQASTVLSTLMDNRDVKSMTWDWFKGNFDVFLEQNVADIRKATISRIFEGCSRAEREDAAQFFTSKAALMPGYERSLAQSLQSIDLCIALKEETGQSLNRALKARP